MLRGFTTEDSESTELEGEWGMEHGCTGWTGFGIDTLQSRESSEVLTSADISKRSRKFVRNAG